MPTRRDPPEQAPADAARTGDRIAKLLARAGVASRREVERMIAEGRVARNGVAVDTANTVLPSLAGVTVDGHAIGAPAPAQLFLYHKPTGLLVAERDPAGRPTIYDRLPAELPRVVPVGRLDLNTEGLLLLTTDGGLKRQLELPATGLPRTYRARAHGPVTQAQLEELIDGVEIEGIRYGSIDANLERRTGTNVWIELTLTEGKNREVRRVLEHLGLQVGRLIRTRYGPFVLGDLPPGEVGEIRQHDLVAFRQSLAGKRAAPADDILPAPLRPPRAEAGEGRSRPERTARSTTNPRTGSPAPASQRSVDVPTRRPATPAGPARARDAEVRGASAERQPASNRGRPDRSPRTPAGDAAPHPSRANRFGATRPRDDASGRPPRPRSGGASPPRDRDASTARPQRPDRTTKSDAPQRSAASQAGRPGGPSRSGPASSFPGRSGQASRDDMKRTTPQSRPGQASGPARHDGTPGRSPSSRPGKPRPPRPTKPKGR